MNKATVPTPRDVMHKALLSGDTRTVKSFLDDGFNIDGRLPTRKGRPERETSLMVAAELGSLAMARLLIHRGADIDAEAEFHTTALDKAIAFNQPAMVNLLLKSGAKINAVGPQRGAVLARVATGNRVSGEWLRPLRLQVNTKKADVLLVC